ncbi:MAG: ABC transporter ATP-binding protein, partial [Chloroflexi bacterium]|nr:ABC transporter ATP-binding protein [Chloroflexota bacterium]
RENIYLNGAILGMHKVEIDRRFDEIVAFAEIERFLDTPVKRYSSGMYVRLAFAVAAHLEPEILLVDEVLAVGDAQFQKKCLGKMGDVTKAGRTVLFVSHNMAAVADLTSRCVHLAEGALYAYGSTRSVIGGYMESAPRAAAGEPIAVAAYRHEASTDRDVLVTHAWVETAGGVSSTVRSGADFAVVVEFEAKRRVDGAHIDVALANQRGQRAALFFSRDSGFALSIRPGTNRVRLHVRALPLAPGDYVADIGMNQSTETRAFDVIRGLPLLSVLPSEPILYWPDRDWGSVYWTDITWSNTEQEPDAQSCAPEVQPAPLETERR